MRQRRALHKETQNYPFWDKRKKLIVVVLVCIVVALGILKTQIGVNAKTTLLASTGEPFDLQPEIVHVILQPGEARKETLTLRSTIPVQVQLRITGIDTDIISLPTGLSEYSLELMKDHELRLPLDVKIPSWYKPGIYTGILKATGEGVRKDVFLIVEVKPAASLLGATLRILPQYKNVEKEKPIYIQFTVRNVGVRRRTSVQVEYGIRDKEGREYPLTQEIITIETQAEIARAFVIPLTVEPGPAAFYARVRNENMERMVIDTFEVGASKEIWGYQEKILIAGMVGIIIVAIVWVCISIRQSRWGRR